MNIHYKAARFILLWASLFGLQACLKEAAETPASLKEYDPAIAINLQLSGLLDTLPAPGAPILIDKDVTIAVIVRADDASGNFHNQLIVEDSTGGINLLLHADNLYLQYPAGRKLYVKLKGLFLGNDHGLPQLGYTPVPDNSGIPQVSAIPESLLRNYILTAGFPAVPAPLNVTLNDLTLVNPGLLNRLVRLQDIEFSNPTYDNTYADAANATSILLQDCAGQQIWLRTSNYARFQAAATPWGKGSITAIYSVYDELPQLLIRDTTDVLMGNLRCDGSAPVKPETISVAAVRQLYRGKDTTLPAYTISGTVTSDIQHKNNGSGNITIQEGQSGILVYLGSTATDLPLLGDAVTVDISGAVLTRYNGMLEIKNIKSSRIKTLSNGQSVTPVTLSIAALLADFSRYESVLVRVEHARLLSGGNYSGNKILDDGSGSILLYTASSATFATRTAPAISKTFQGIVTLYDTVKELKIRDPDIDVY